MLNLDILYFSPLALQAGTGGAARVRNMLGVLRKLHSSTQLVSYAPQKKISVIHQRVNTYLNTTTVYFPSSLPKIFKLFALLIIAIYGLGYVRQSQIILAHSPGIVYGFPALILAKVFNKPLIIDLTDSKDFDTPGFVYNGVLRKADIVFTVSRHLEAIAKEIGCRRVIHIPGFIDTDAFKYNASVRAKIRKELKICDDEVVIGYAGAFSPDEGLSLLFKAFQELSRRYKDIKLILIGGLRIPDLDDAQLLNEPGSKDRVIFVPPQPYELVPEYLSALDIACSPKIDCPANRVADPIRVYEYMSVGLPVIASSIGETVNVIENGIDGFLFKPGDNEDLMRALEHAVQNLESLQELRSKAKEKVIRGYSQLVALKKIEDALANLMDKA